MRFSTLRTRGFSIVELLVSLAIGLLVLVFAMRLITGSEKSKQSALGSSDSMQNGMLAMFSISGDAQQAGFGLNDPILIGCNTRLTDKEGFQLAPAQRGAATVRPLAPAIIVSNGSAPDVISLYSGSSPTGTGTLRLVSDYFGGNRLNVDRMPSYGFRLGDVVVVAPENRGGDCALAQLSAPPGTVATVAGAAAAPAMSVARRRRKPLATDQVCSDSVAAGPRLKTRVLPPLKFMPSSPVL